MIPPLAFSTNEGNTAAVSILSTPSNDSDQDGLPNDYEELFGLNRFRNDADEDLDNDGLTNIEEFRRGTIPNNPDTDADGIPDGQDGAPLHPAEPPPPGQLVSPVAGGPGRSPAGARPGPTRLGPKEGIGRVNLDL